MHVCIIQVELVTRCRVIALIMDKLRHFQLFLKGIYNRWAPLRVHTDTHVPYGEDNFTPRACARDSSRRHSVVPRPQPQGGKGECGHNPWARERNLSVPI